MRVIAITAALLLAVLAILPAQAGDPTVDPWKAWGDGRTADKKHVDGQIVQLENTYPSFCETAAKKGVDPRVCETALKMELATAKRDAAVLEFEIAIAGTDPNDRAELLKIVPEGEINSGYAISKRQRDQISQFITKKMAAESMTTGSR